VVAAVERGATTHFVGLQQGVAFLLSDRI